MAEGWPPTALGPRAPSIWLDDRFRAGHLSGAAPLSPHCLLSLSWVRRWGKGADPTRLRHGSPVLFRSLCSGAVGEAGEREHRGAGPGPPRLGRAISPHRQQADPRTGQSRPGRIPDETPAGQVCGRGARRIEKTTSSRGFARHRHNLAHLGSNSADFGPHVVRLAKLEGQAPPTPTTPGPDSAVVLCDLDRTWQELVEFWPGIGQFRGDLGRSQPEFGGLQVGGMSRVIGICLFVSIEAAANDGPGTRMTRTRGADALYQRCKRNRSPSVEVDNI